MIGDVLKEADFWFALGHDSGQIRPEMPGIRRAFPLSGGAERLARIASMNNVNKSPPRAGVEPLEVAPDWSAVKDSVRHSGEKYILAEPFNLNVADCSVAKDAPESVVKSAYAGTN